MREHFRLDEEKTYARLKMLQELVGERALMGKPCPYLATQLSELDVLCGLLHEEVRKMIKHVEKATSD